MARKSNAGTLVVKLEADGSKLESDVGAALKRAESKIDGLGSGTKLGALSNKIADAFGGADGVLGKVSGQFGVLGTAAEGALSGVGVAASAAAAGVGVLALGALASVNAFTSLAADVEKFKTITGASAENASRLVASLDDVGVSADDGAKAFAALAKNADSKAFATLGIEVARAKDGTVNLAGTFAAVLDKVKGIPDPVQRANVLTAAFGKSWAQITPLIERGSEAFKKSLSANEGQVLSEKDLQAARDYKASMDDLGDAFLEVKIAAGRVVLPWLADAVKGTSALIAGMETLGGKVGTIFALKPPEWLTGGKNIGGILKDGLLNSAIPGISAFVDKSDKAGKSTKDLGDTAAKAQIDLGQLGEAGTDAGAKLEDAAKAAKKAFDAQFEGVDATLKLAGAQDSLKSALDRLSDATGIGLAGQIASAKASLDAARAKREDAQAAQALTDARKREADVAVEGAKRIKDAEKSVNDLRAKGIDLADAARRAEGAAADARRDLAAAVKDEKRAQEDYDRAIGRLPAKIADVTSALQDQLRARNDLADLSDSTAELTSQLAKANRELATFDATGKAAAADRAESLRLAAEDAANRAAVSRLDAGKKPADASLANRAAEDQIAANEALRTYQSQAADILDVEGQRLELLRRRDALVRRLAEVEKVDRPNAQKALEAATTASDRLKNGAAIGSPEEQAAAKQLEAATGKVADAQDRVTQAVKDSARASADSMRNYDDIVQANRNVQQVIADVKRDQATAHQAVLQQIADERLRRQELALGQLQAQETIRKKAAEVASATLGAANAAVAVLKAGGKVPNLSAFDAIKARLNAIGDAKDAARLSAVIGQLSTIKALGATQPSAAVAAAATLTGGRALPAPPATAFTTAGIPQYIAKPTTSNQTINVTINNPMAEKATVSTFKAVAAAAARKP